MREWIQKCIWRVFVIVLVKRGLMRGKTEGGKRGNIRREGEYSTGRTR